MAGRPRVHRVCPPARPYPEWPQGCRSGKSGSAPGCPSWLCPSRPGRLEPMITVDRLTKRYGHFTAVDDISFEVKPGQVTGFLGPNGAGKSTAMRIMAGLTPATSGTTTVLGRALRPPAQPGPPRRSPPRRLRAARGAHRPRGPHR